MLVVLILGSAVSSRADELLVSAAASLTESMNEIGAAYSKANPHTNVRFNFGSSGALEKQIEQGGQVDVCVSTANNEMNSIQRKVKIEVCSRGYIAGNRLVLIVPVKSRAAVRRWDDLKSPSVQRVAISNPDSVPSGRYAREALEKRGLWA